MKMNKNMSQREIVREFVIAKSGITEILSKLQGRVSTSGRPGCGRPQKLYQRMVQKLIRAIKAQLEKTSRQIMDECELSNLV